MMDFVKSLEDVAFEAREIDLSPDHPTICAVADLGGGVEIHGMCDLRANPGMLFFPMTPGEMHDNFGYVHYLVFNNGRLVGDYTSNIHPMDHHPDEGVVDLTSRRLMAAS